MMTLIAGTLMVPLLGTLDSGLTRTKAFSIQKVMQNLAESKMNEAIQKVVFAGEDVSGEDYVATYPNTDIPEYEFRIRTEVKANLTLSHDAVEFAPHSKLKAFSVEVGLRQQFDNQAIDVDVATISMFTLLDPSRVAPDNLYVADPVNNNIYVLNPTTHTKIKHYNLGAGTASQPFFLAAHPNGDWLAIKCFQKILLMDIRSGSSGNHGQIFFNSYLMLGQTDEPTTGKDGYRLGRGLAWRPDGKFLFFTFRNDSNTSSNLMLQCLEAPSSLPAVGDVPTSDWSSPSGWSNIDLLSPSVTDMEMGQDGYLYISRPSTSDSTKPIMRLNTVSMTMEYPNPGYSGDAETNKAMGRAIATSWDGKEYGYIFKGFHSSPAKSMGLGFGLTDTRTATQYIDMDETKTGISFVGVDDVDDVVFSRDNRWMIFPKQNNANSEKVCAFKRSTEGTWESSDFTGNVEKDFNPGGSLSSTLNTAMAIKHGPNFKEFMVDEYGSGKMYFFNEKKFLYSTLEYDSWTIPPEFPGGRISDFAGRIPEWVWVGVSDGSNHQIQCLDLYRSGGSWDENKELTTSASPDFLAVSPGGDRYYYGLENLNMIYIRSLLDDTTTSHALPASSNPRKGAWMLDGSLIVGVKNSGDATVVNGEITTTETNVKNGFSVYTCSGNNTLTFSIGLHIKGNTTWEVLDIAPMNRRNGAYVLMVKTDDYLQSKIVWIEKSMTRGMSGTEGLLEYKIMGIWESRFDGMPAGQPISMALAPDDSLLAVVDCKGASNRYKVWIYDLQNQRFPSQPGLVALGYEGVPSSEIFPDSSVVSGFDLHEGLTTMADCAFYSDYPVNFDVSDSATIPVDDNSWRFFGYWYPTYAVKTFGANVNDGFRVGVNGAFPFPDYNPNSAYWTDLSGSNFKMSWDFSWSANAPKLVQFETFNDDTGHKTVIGYTTNTDTPTGVSGAGTPFTITAATNYSSIPKRDFRAFRFRPTLIKELLLDGTNNQPYIESYDQSGSNRAKCSVAFHKDRGRCYLFIMDDWDERIFGIPLFGEPQYKYGSNFYISLDAAFTQIDNSTDFGEISISPDGSRLVVYPNSGVSGDYGIITVKIDYEIPFPTNPTFKDPTYLALSDANDRVKCFGVREANSITSRVNNYTARASLPAAATGNNMACLGQSGLFVTGFASGYDGTAENTVRKYDPVADSYSTLATLLGNRKQSGLVHYDDKLLVFGGKDDTPLNQSSVQIYDFANTSWSQQKNLQENDNTDIPWSAMGACQTPYGLVLAGGSKGIPSITEINANANFSSISGQLTLNKLTANAAEMAISSGLEFARDLVPGGGTCFITNPLFCSANTNIYSYFITETANNCGIRFIIQNLGPGKKGDNTHYRNAGWVGGDFDDVANSNVSLFMSPIHNADLTPTSLSDDGVVCIDEDGVLTWNSPAGSYVDTEANAFLDHGDGVQTNHWWVIYDSDSKVLNVWRHSSNAPESATWLIRNYSYDLFSKQTGGTGGNIYIGFGGSTGEAKDSPDCYAKVTDWHLKVWDTPTFNTYIDVGNAQFSTPSWPRSGLTFRGEAADNSGYARLNDGNSAGDWGQFWTTGQTMSGLSFRSAFSMKMETGAHGMTFCVQGEGNSPGTEADPNSKGFKGVSNSLAVAYDTYDDGASEVSHSSIFALKNGDIGTPYGPSLNTQTLLPLAYTLDTDSIQYSWVEYDSPSRLLKVFYSGTASSKPTGPDFSLILNADLDTLTGSTGYLGMTAMGGDDMLDGCAAHSVCSFKLQTKTLAATTEEITNKVKVYYPQVAIHGNVSGLVAHYKFDDSPGSTAADSSGNGHTGTLMNMTSPGCWVSGKYGTCLSFDGSNDYVQIPDHNQLDVSNITLSAWIKGTILSDLRIIDKTTVGFSDGYNMDNHTGYIRLIGNDNAYSSTALTTGVWVHVAATFDGTTTRFYKDGVLDGTSLLITALPVNTLPLRIGAGSTGSNNFSGLIDDVRIYDRALSQDEIQAVMRGGTFFGESLSLTDLPVAMKDGVLVNHYSRKDRKHYLYYIGGRTDNSNSLPTYFIYRYNYDDNTWAGKLAHVNLSADYKKYGVAACSWGDEIFTFGGADGSGSVKKTGLAFNPDTSKTRPLADFPTTPSAVVYQSAIPVGPHIFLLGGATSPSSGGGKNYVYRYTP